MISLVDRIDVNSKIPKYLQVVKLFENDIENGVFKYGQKIPSINETSESYYLSRDTVEKAYTELKTRGIIKPVRGKGYYVTSLETNHVTKVLLLFNKLSTHKKNVYYSLIASLGKKAKVDLQIYHYDFNFFCSILENCLGDYDYYVVMPHFNTPHDNLKEVLNQIPAEKLILLDKKIEGIKYQSCVYQDFERDIIDALRDGEDLFYKYSKLSLVFPQSSLHPVEIVKGFVIFCKIMSLDYSVVNDINQEIVKQGSAYIVIEESDLVDVIKSCKTQKLKLGKDVGLISYNDTPLKEVLADGITVISTNFDMMGYTVGKLILEKKKESIRNPFRLIRRKSL
jgi:DNA-binding transcriptional regulator YhcF (GntR family)